MASPATRLYEQLGQRIRKRRKALDLTQEDVAAKVGLKRTSITNMESGRQRVPLHQLQTVAEALDTDLRELLPTREELAAPERVSVVVGGVRTDAPPETAKFIEELLRAKRGESDGNRSNRSTGKGTAGGRQDPPPLQPGQTPNRR